MRKQRYSRSVGLLSIIFILASVYWIPLGYAEDSPPCLIEEISQQKDLLQNSAKKLGLKMHEGIITRAKEPLSPIFPSQISINGEKELTLDLTAWSGYIFTVNSDESAFYISNPDGELVGGVDRAYSQSENGEVSQARFQVMNRTLFIHFNEIVSGDVHFDYLNASGNENLTVFSRERESLVTIPPDYVYNPSQGWAHDYCTNAPHEFNVLGNRADFRGPCARHDMCYMKKKCRSRECDGWLLNDLKINCRVSIAASNPYRLACLATADAYIIGVLAWQDVLAQHDWPRC